MSESTIISRREVRGYEDDSPQTWPTPFPEKRSSNHFEGLFHAFGADSLSSLDMKEIADTIADAVAPEDPNIRQQALTYLQHLQSAALALTLIQSGFDLGPICEQSRNAEVRLRLINAGFIAKQVSDIVCFVVGYGFPPTINPDELRQELAASIFAIQTASQTGIDLSQLCDTVSIQYGPEFQIDNTGIKSYVCSNGTATTGYSVTSSSTSSSLSSFTLSPTSGTSNGTISSFGTSEEGTWSNSTS
jgi:hypothetical protein